MAAGGGECGGSAAAGEGCVGSVVGADWRSDTGSVGGVYGGAGGGVCGESGGATDSGAGGAPADGAAGGCASVVSPGAPQLRQKR